MRPAKFDNTAHEQLILDEENEVTEIFFINEGIVGIGYYMMSQGLSKKQFIIGIECKANSSICEYYVCSDKKSEFIYIAIQSVEAISLSKKFLRSEIFPKYPTIAAKIMKGAQFRYMKNIKNKLNDKRNKHIEEINL